MLRDDPSHAAPRTGPAASAGPAILWRARGEARLTRQAADQFEVRYRGSTAALTGLTPGMIAGLEQLFFEGAGEGALTDPLLDEAPSALAEWYCHLDLLQRQTAIEWVASDGLGELARLTALTGAFRPAFTPLDPSVTYTLSGFVFLRALGEAWVAESPLAHARVRLSRRGAALLAGLPIPGTPVELLTAATDAAPGVDSLLLLLSAAGMLTPTDESGRSEADAAAHAKGWSFPDALFHFRSREGRSDGAFGARPGSPKPEPLPREGTVSPDRIALERPAPGGNDGLGDLLAARRSVRTYGAEPVSLDKLSQLLFRVAGDIPGDPVRRSYPSGGATYPLQLYVVSAHCNGLGAGVFRYDPASHALDRISTGATELDNLIHMYEGKAASDPLQVLLLVTVEMGRVTRRYDGIGYSLVLKEVGALFQSLYLVATAMDLAPCAIGMGNGEVAARSLGVDPLAEAVVGEFALGSRG